MKRGDIYYILEGAYVGSEQKAGRPAVIVSNETFNSKSSTVEIVFLTTKPKSSIPTHITIRSATYVSTALCEQITSVSKERVGEFVGACTDSEMAQIDTALKISLGLSDDRFYESRQNDDLVNDLRAKLLQVTLERDIHKTNYDNIINSLIIGGNNRG
jgi:mRNA interferase MazF